MNLAKNFAFLQSHCTEATNLLELHKSLLESIPKEENKYVESNYRIFWWLMIRASLYSSINLLSKLIDQQKSSQSVKNLLCLIKSKKSEFTPDSFRHRLPEKGGYPNLALRCVYPGDDEVDKDIELVSSTNKDVSRFVIWRNNYYSHFSKVIIEDSTSLSERFPLNLDDLELLLGRCGTLLNKYEKIYSASTSSRKYVEFGDHLHLIESQRDLLLNQMAQRDLLLSQHNRNTQQDSTLDT